LHGHCRLAGVEFVARGHLIWVRKIALSGNLIHQSDRGIQDFAIRYAERLGEVAISPSLGSVGDSHDNAVAETNKGLYQGPWRNIEAVEHATFE
jgi:transposase InsO family protein